jgi:hypothetical protein
LHDVLINTLEIDQENLHQASKIVNLNFTGLLVCLLVFDHLVNFREEERDHVVSHFFQLLGVAILHDVTNEISGVVEAWVGCVFGREDQVQANLHDILEAFVHARYLLIFLVIEGYEDVLDDSKSIHLDDWALLIVSKSALKLNVDLAQAIFFEKDTRAMESQFTQKLKSLVSHHQVITACILVDPHEYMHELSM